MKLKLLDTNEVTLETKDKLCKENISLVVDDTNIAPENIKSGVSILGVRGTLQSGGGSGSLETCTVTYKPFSPTPPGDYQIKYTDSTGKLNTTNYNPMQNIEIVCQKNTLIFFEGIPSTPKITAEDGSPWSKFFAGSVVIAVTSNTIVRNG